MKTPRWGGAGKGPMRVTWMQVWADLLAAGVDRNAIEKQPNALLVGPWRQLRIQQQLTKNGKCSQ